jgi:hypothetical protein
VRFDLDLHLPGPRAEVEASLGEPGWYEAVAAAAPTWAPELLEVQDADGHLVSRARYRFRGQLNGAARRVLDPSRLSWVQVADLDRARHHVEVQVIPDSYADRLRCHLVVDLVEEGPAQTLRRFSGEVHVKAPLVGGQVERAIVSGLGDHVRYEAEVFARYVRDRR